MDEVVSSFLCLGLLVGGIAFVAFIVREVQRGNQRHYDDVNAARQAYRNSLAHLKAHPSNPELRQQTLHLGRAYANLTRNRRGVALFDEVALMNDINAASAGAVNQARPPEPEPISPIDTRLAQLSKLKESGLISEEDYTKRKQQILDEV